MTTNVVTADATNAGSETVGNVAVNGYFLANVIRANVSLGGGSLETPGALIINTDMGVESAAGANVVAITTNTSYSNVTLSALYQRFSGIDLRLLANIHAIGNTFVANVVDVDFNITNVNFSGTDFEVVANSTFTGNFNVNSTSSIIEGGSLNVHSNTTFLGTSLVSSSNTTIGGTDLSITSNGEFSGDITYSGTSTFTGAADFTGTNFTASSNVNLTGANVTYTGTDFVVTANARFTGTNYKLESGGNVTFGGNVPNSEHVGTFHGNVWLHSLTFQDGNTFTYGVLAPYIQNTDSRVISGNLSFSASNLTFTTGFAIGNDTINSVFTDNEITPSNGFTIGSGIFYSNNYTDLSGLTKFTGTVSTGGANVGHQTLTEAANVTWDLSDGEVAFLTLTANDVYVNEPTNKKVGFFMLHLIQANGGGWIPTFDPNYKFSANVDPILATANGHRDIFSFICDGSYMYAAQAPDFS